MKTHKYITLFLLCCLFFGTVYASSNNISYKQKIVDVSDQMWTDISGEREIFSKNNFTFDIKSPTTDNNTVNKLINAITRSKIIYYKKWASNKKNAGGLYITYNIPKTPLPTGPYFSLEVQEFIGKKTYRTMYIFGSEVNVNNGNNDAICGNKIKEGNEQCDNGQRNGFPCTPIYGNDCTFCSESCILNYVIANYCGDGQKNGKDPLATSKTE